MSFAHCRPAPLGRTLCSTRLVRWLFRLETSSQGQQQRRRVVRVPGPAPDPRVGPRPSLQFWRLVTSALSAGRLGDCTRDRDTGASGSGLRAVEAKTVTLAFPFLLRARNHETKSRYIKQLYDVSVSHCLATVCVPNFTIVCSFRPHRHLSTLTFAMHVKLLCFATSHTNTHLEP